MDRKAVGLLVKLKHADIGSFVEEFAVNISPGGMFIRSREPQPVGTLVKFEVRIAEGVRVLKGSAVVRWVRPPEDLSGPSGMGLQFSELEPASQALVERMLRHKGEVPSQSVVSAPPRPATPPAVPVVPPVVGIPSVAPVMPGMPVSRPISEARPSELLPPPPPPPTTAVDIPLDELIAYSAEPEETPSPVADLVPPRPPLRQPGGGLEFDLADLSAAVSSSANRPGGPAPPVPAPPQPVARSAAPVLTPAAPKPAPLPPEPKSTPGQVRTVFLTPPANIEGKGPVIGIDLGTTNSCVAVIQNHKPTVLRSREGYNTIPSVVSLSSQGKLLVSHRAKSQVLLRPEQTIYGAKRLVGRPYDSAVVNQVRERFHYEIVPDSRGRAAVRMGESVLSLEEVQGIILRECKELAEQHLGQKVERAVVTVPAYYSEPQREAVRRAGWMAGLKVERILNEPTSAALAYGLNREMSKKVLVYDLGGGTFDATLLRIDKNVFEVLATGGDIFLGGMDFDSILVDLLLERFQKQEKVTFQGDRIALSRVSDAAERAKVALSESSTYEVHIPMLMMDEAGKPRDMHVTLTRAEMERACLPLVMRTLDVVRDVLLDAKLRASEVDDILLVGGQSRMPLVREKLREAFGKAPHAGVNTDEAVALGAALYSSAVDKVSSVVLIDVLPMTIGVAMPGGAFTRVVERNTPLPAQRSFAVSTTRDDEEVLELSIFQGEDTHISANEYLGTVRLEGLPKGPKGSVRVAVTLRLDAECVVHVTAQEYSTRKEVRATLATRYSPEELRQRLGVATDAARAAEERRGQDLKERSGRFWGFLKKVVGKA